MLPTIEQVKQFLLGTIIPPSVAAAATWVVVNVPLLSTFFHLTAAQIGNQFTQIAIFGVSWVTTWATQHHILAGKYTPGAKALAAGQAPTGISARGK